ncbi:HNH endonuclease signature motif containing protein [Streptomyces apocyni]|uniref:HNH endonuclease signature motif containing protein n=1 Tax=Streptomyces apocyni TaxID=2654677 RepID=UPI001E466B6C|nr:HNH endonuclease [Streptomyces apocyni]
MRRLELPLSSHPRHYLARRIKHYGIDTSHFQDEPLPQRERRVYSKELLEDAAAHSHSIRELMEYIGLDPREGPYWHIRKRLDKFGIDTSHFTSGNTQVPRAVPRAELAAAVSASVSLAGVLRLLGFTDNSTNRARIKRSLQTHVIPTGHFTGQGHGRGIRSRYRKPASEILVRLESGAPRAKTFTLRRALDDLHVPHICTECGVGDVWQGKRLVLEIDHINGDRLDNRRENLRYLCPSCHSQTSTFGKRSRHTDPMPGAIQ